jgi:uncharacterized protein (DUF58 family)
MAASSLQRGVRGKLTSPGALVVALIVASSGLGMDATRTMAYQAFTFLMTLFLASLLFSIFIRARFTARRILPPTATVGSPLRYAVEITNLGPRPVDGAIYTEIQKDPRPTYHEFATMTTASERGINAYDRYVGPYRWFEIIASRLPIKQKDHTAPFIPPGATVRMEIETIPKTRGYLRFEGATIGAPDPFGLVKSNCDISAIGTIPVFPRRYKCRPFGLPGRRKYNQGGVALASSVGDSEEFVGLRDYRPGDPLRNIHWRSWAKRGIPVVKEHQQEFFSRHALLLDTFMDVDISDLFEDAVSVAASFVSNLDTRDALLDLMFVGAQTYMFTSGRSLGAVQGLLEALTPVTPCRDKRFSHLAGSVEDRLSLLSGVACVLIAWDDERKDFIARLMSINIPVKVFVVVESIPPGGIDPGPMKKAPNMFHVLESGKIEEGLARI